MQNRYCTVVDPGIILYLSVLNNFLPLFAYKLEYYTLHTLPGLNKKNEKIKEKDGDDEHLCKTFSRLLQENVICLLIKCDLHTMKNILE